MNLKKMCEVAARYSDRYDEFERTEDGDGRLVYQDDALHYFNVFRDAINEAYFEVSRTRLSPDTQSRQMVGEGGTLALEAIYPPVASVIGVYDEMGASAVNYRFKTRFQLELPGRSAGDQVTLRYHYLPDRLETIYDEPIFPESMVDPMVYIALAVARIWQSERRMEEYQTWMAEYYRKLRLVKPSAADARMRRVPRLVLR